MSEYRILAMNFGSTSTKLAVFDDKEVVCYDTLRHSSEEMAHIKSFSDDEAFRLPLVWGFLEQHQIPKESLNAVVGRGGLTRPIESGTYAVDQEMLDDMSTGRYGVHACNLGAILAYDIASPLGIPAFVVDPGVVDELSDLARLSGHPAIPRRSVFHALNQKAMARRYAEETNQAYEDLNLIVAHMGGGITVGAHQKGRVVDITNGTDGEGPFTPERTGALSVVNVLRLVETGELGDLKAIRRLLGGAGGLVAYLGTTNAKEVSERVKNGDKEAETIYRGMAYQISKEIGSLGAVLRGEVDQIILTGGLAYDDMLMGWIKEQVGFLAPITVYPGEDELTALLGGALRALRGETEVKVYGQVRKDV